MACIRIIAVPPGPAPEWVREEWVGLVLPLPEGPMGRRRLLSMSAVLPPSRGCLSSLFESGLYPWLLHLYAWLTDSLMKVDGYAVEALRAVEILSVDSPEAAAWWHQSAPSLMTYFPLGSETGFECRHDRTRRRAQGTPKSGFRGGAMTCHSALACLDQNPHLGGAENKS
jgi:hypothetical protein